MLALEVEYLLGRAVATDPSHRDRVEWPPHPSRLFSALVDSLADVRAAEPASAGACEEALRWLECLDPPHIRASLDRHVSERTWPLKYWVPINDEVADKLRSAPLVEQRKRQERFFPTAVPESPIVVFSWPWVEPPQVVVRAIERLAHGVPYLGHSSSLVRITCRTTEAEPATLVPSAGGRLRLRVAGPGRLARLDAVHEARTQDTLVQPPRGREVGYDLALPSTPRGPHGAATVLSLSNVRVRVEDTAPLAARLREAVLAHLPAGTSETLTGHRPDNAPSRTPHVAFVPLAHVGHAHADMLVKGFAVVMPETIDAESAFLLDEAIELVASRPFPLGPRGVGKLGRADSNDGLKSLNWGGYVGDATEWASVTPVALGAHPKPKKGLTVEAIVVRELAHLGLPAPAEVLLGNVAFIERCPRAQDFVRGSAHAIQGRLLRHVYLRFAEEVSGPILLGAGRHTGLGLLRPYRRMR
jgi:CRISPR-associated protein Csb2